MTRERVMIAAGVSVGAVALLRWQWKRWVLNHMEGAA